MQKHVNDTTLLAHIRELPHARATFKQLVREFGTRGQDREKLEAALERLAAKGDLIELRSGQFVSVEGSAEYIAGRLSIHRDRYGFLIPDRRPERIQGDVFLPAGETVKAMHGDRVLVHIRKIDREGRAEGEIVRVLSRAHPTVVGEFRIHRRGNFVVPSDTRVQQWIEIPEGMEFPPVDISVDRVGVVQRAVSSVEELDGMVVNVEVLEYPEDEEHAVGRVVEILGYPDDFGIDVEIVIRKHHLPHHFPVEVVEQAKRISPTIPEEEIARRRDFRHLDIVTIDGETARDFDDAVWVEKLPNGHFALQVHIADVSHYIKPGTPIDIEAVLRGTSVYFPDRAVPMLPLELSTDICSLRPQVDRLVLSALVELDHRGDIVAQEFTKGIIRSVERMTYTGVYKLLEGDPQLRERYAPLVTRFETMRELALILNRKRARRGSIDFDMPEANIELDMSGQMIGVTRSERNIAHRLIEEFMLTANETVAAHLEQAEIPSVYRIHETPEAKRVLEFEEIAAHFGYSLGMGAMPVKRFPTVQRRRDGRKIRKDTVIADEAFQISSRNYQRLISKIEGKPEERILSYLMLRSLKQARYSEENRGHFALAAQSYTHFTSPIRRYPDLIVHRILSQYLDNHSALFQEGDLQPLTDDCSFTERRAAEAERELIEWKKVKFMEDRVGEEFNALIISTTKFGFFVELVDLFIEGLVPLETLHGDRFRYQENNRKIIGERTRKMYSIGDSVNVRLDRADSVERKLQFAVVEPVAKRTRKARQR